MGQLVALLPLISLQTGQVEQLQVGTLLVAVAEETDLKLGGSPTSSQILHSWARLLMGSHPTTGVGQEVKFHNVPRRQRAGTIWWTDE